MGIPQVPDQVRRGPTLALRAVFAGIGKIVMAADRPQASSSQPAGQDSAERQRSAARRQQRSAPPPAESRWRSLDQTGNVRLLSAEDLRDEDEAGGTTAGQSLTAAAQSSQPPPPAAGKPLVPEETLPLPRYDDLPLASIRARLRGLSVSQLRILAEYEARNAERPEVLGMFERRIEKLEAQS
jgi:hypothetical protein